MTSDPLIVALDVPSLSEAEKIVQALDSECGFYKVGMELYAAQGPEVIDWLHSQGKSVFLDLKFYDIGETVKRAVSAVAKHGVRFLTVHGSREVLRAAVEGRGNTLLRLLGVSVLTSFDEQDLRDLGYPASVTELVALRVKNARELGIDGVVASPLEAAAVREVAGPEMLIVTPGVRSATADAGDQKRFATPADAIRNGADYLVIGRQVTRAADPALALRAIRAEIGRE